MKHKHVGGLCASNGDSLDQLVTSICKCLRPRSVCGFWSDFTFDIYVPPDLAHFTKFLD